MARGRVRVRGAPPTPSTADAGVLRRLFSWTKSLRPPLAWFLQKPFEAAEGAGVRWVGAALHLYRCMCPTWRPLWGKEAGLLLQRFNFWVSGRALGAGDGPLSSPMGGRTARGFGLPAVTCLKRTCPHRCPAPGCALQAGVSSQGLPGHCGEGAVPEPCPPCAQDSLRAATRR